MTRLIVVLAIVLLLPWPSGASGGYWEVVDIPYASRPGTCPHLTSLDLYVPQTGSGFPVLVWVHGGTWRAGDKGNVGDKPQAFTDAGYLLVSVNYRLSPAVQHPAHVEDAAASLAWVHDHIDRYGGDPARIFLIGHSAGAHLVALVATDGRYLAGHGLDLELIAGVVRLDGLYDIPARMHQGSLAAALNLPPVFGNDPEAWWDASPVAHAAPGKGMPPFLVVSAGRWGAAQQQADGIAAALIAAGVYVDRHHAADKDHAGLNRDLGRAGDPVTSQVLGFLGRVQSVKNHIQEIPLPTR